MSENRGQRIYRTIMIIIITALITGIITTITVYRRTSELMGGSGAIKAGSSQGLELTLSRIRAMLDKEYIGTLDDKKMIEGAIKGYVAGIGDEYAEYYTAEEMSEEMDEVMGNYVGIGIYMLVNSVKGEIYVSEPMEGSPAEEAGIKSGDMITKVDGEEVTTENVTDMSNKIKGEEGTKVKLEIKREDKSFDIEVKRKKIVVSHIKSKVINNNIGYIDISDFDGGAAQEFKTKYQELEKKGIKSLIIDIRNNGGGIVDEAIDILDMICPKGSTLLIAVNKNDKEEVTKAKKSSKIDLPIVVLANESSASASEILAGALKDNGIAKLVGKKTYGKGVIQTLLQLSDGSGLKMTTEEYCTPSGSKINKVGIKPDYEVDLPKNIDELTDENDTQLQKAIELLK